MYAKNSRFTLNATSESAAIDRFFDFSRFNFSLKYTWGFNKVAQRFQALY